MSRVGPGLRWVVEQCRANNDNAAFGRFRLGTEIDPKELADTVPASVLDDLRTEDLIEQRGEAARLTVSCNSVNGIVSIMPATQAVDADHIHLNFDSIYLLKLIWELVTPGGRALELGTGNGLIAAYLIARFNQVVATDIHGPSIRFAQMTLDANRVRGRMSEVVCADIGAGLRAESFDLVVANPPWSPAFPRDEHGRVVTFADGGPTGTELPGRFLNDAVRLLAPGGTAIVLGFDPTYDDGARPLRDKIDAVRRDGVDVDVFVSDSCEPGVVHTSLSKRIANLRDANHVAMVVRKAPRAA